MDNPDDTTKVVSRQKRAAAARALDDMMTRSAMTRKARRLWGGDGRTLRKIRNLQERLQGPERATMSLLEVLRALEALYEFGLRDKVSLATTPVPLQWQKEPGAAAALKAVIAHQTFPLTVYRAAGLMPSLLRAAGLLRRKDADERQGVLPFARAI